ncbi:hypothetical protein U9R90_06735 [Streptomyces sp. E11-3]|uniref:hypothetical protein n=1 Tax=Streptomyces sp. E11-3 TaxID=3110112 RepID=UPI00397FBE8E
MLSGKCEKMGKGFPEAAEYKGKGPHVMAVFQDDHEADTDGTGGYTFWQVRFSGTKILTGSEDPAGVELLVCGEGRKGSQRVGACNYTRLGQSSSTYPLYAQTYKYTVYELRTGRVLKTFEAGTGTGSQTCPYRLSSVGDQKPSRVYAQMSRDRTEDLLRQFVTGPAR